MSENRDEYLGELLSQLEEPVHSAEYYQTLWTRVPRRRRFRVRHLLLVAVLASVATLAVGSAAVVFLPSLVGTSSRGSGANSDQTHLPSVIAKSPPSDTNPQATASIERFIARYLRLSSMASAPGLDGREGRSRLKHLLAPTAQVPPLVLSSLVRQRLVSIGREGKVTYECSFSIQSMTIEQEGQRAKVEVAPVVSFATYVKDGQVRYIELTVTRHRLSLEKNGNGDWLVLVDTVTALNW